MDSTARSSVSAIVEYDYSAKEPDELNLVKGTIIHNIKVQTGGWWAGTLTSGKTGMFPDNFVRVLEADEKNPVVLRDKSATLNRKCKAVYSYTQNNNDELSLAVGDVIEFLGEVEEGWWRGKLGSKVGVFPSNFVVKLESVSPILANRRSIGASKIKANISSSRENLAPALVQNASVALEKDAPVLPPKPVRELCKVLYPYQQSNEDELELSEGDIITILSKELPDKGWWKGELKGKIGVFPDNFVTPLSPDSSPTKESSQSKDAANLHKPDRPPPYSSIGANNKSSSRKSDSFGSKDSLNDSGIVTGNVAAYRKSLENKVLDGNSVEKTNRKSMERNSTDLIKRLESLDDKKVTPPPVLSKKPMVPIKKSPTTGNVSAGSIFSGLKQHKVKKENRSSSNDSLDGIGNSKTSYFADNSEKSVVGEYFKKEENSEFDNVERSSILPDMRSGRAKAPKRRPPTAAINIIGDNNNSTYQNGNSGYAESEVKSESLDEETTKPKPRNWEKQKVPWMDELKASQAKKISPNIESRSPETNKSFEHESNNEKFDMSKSFSSSYVSSQKRSSDISQFEVRSSSVDVKSTSTAAHEGIYKKDNENLMAKSMSSIISSRISTVAESAIQDDKIEQTRPSSVKLRNRSISPVGGLINKSHPQSIPLPETTPQQPQPQQTNKLATADLVHPDNVCARVVDLEQKVLQLEKIVYDQKQTIDDLLKSVRDESEKVKSLKNELDKYAQCVTQV